MARPFKTGLSYFPWDVDFKKDSKIRKLRYKYGPLGFCIYFDLVAMVYSEGYYLEMDIDSVADIIAMEIGGNFVKREKVKEVIHACADIGLFDKRLMLQGVITCSSIQKQFILSTKRRQNINIDKYWLLDLTTTSEYKVLFDIPKNNNNVNIKKDNVNINYDNDYDSTQKEKEIDIIDKIIDKRNSNSPSLHFFTQSLIENEYISKYDLEYYKYNDLFKELIKEYGFDKVRCVVWYILKYTKKSISNIEFKFTYFKTSIMNNLEKLNNKENRRNESWEEYLRRVVQILDK